MPINIGVLFRGSFWSRIGRKHVEEIDKRIKEGPINMSLYHDLELELEDLAHIVKKLQKRRDKCIPNCCYIHRVPPEVVAHIFAFTAIVDPPQATEQEYDHPSGDNVTYYDLGWITVTHVCSRWREISLDEASLWANSVCKLPHARQVMLKRARSAPLTLEVYTTYSPQKGMDLALVKFVIKHLSRARRIYARFASFTHETMFADAMSEASLPLLEYFKYDGRYWTETRHLSAPRLSSCMLTTSPFAWDPKSITHLDLKQGPYGASSIHFDELCDLLKASEQLQWLRIHDTVGTPPEKCSGAVAILPYLDYISLTDTPEGCVALLRHISPSPHARIILSLHYPTETDEGLSDILGSTLRSRYFNKDNSLNPTAISFKLDDDGSLHVRLFAPAHRNHIDNDHDVKPFRFGYELTHQLTLQNWNAPNRGTGVTFIEAGEQLMNAFAVTGIDELALDVPGFYTTDVCRQTFSLFPDVHTLHLPSASTLHDLRTSLTSESDDDPNKSLLKKLRKLCIETINLKPGLQAGKGTLLDDAIGLLEMLRDREGMGLVVRRVKLGRLKWGEKGTVDVSSPPHGFKTMFKIFAGKVKEMVREGKVVYFPARKDMSLM